MLYTIWQIKRSFTNMLYLGFKEPEWKSIAEKINKLQDVWAYLDGNKEIIKDYLNSLNTNKDWKSIRTLDREDKISNMDNEALWKILVALGLDKTKISGDWYYLSFLANKINNFKYEKTQIQNIAKEDTKKLNEDIKSTILSPEQAIVRKFEAILLRGKPTKKQIIELQENLVKLGYKLEGKNNWIDWYYWGSTKDAFETEFKKTNEVIKNQKDNSVTDLESLSTNPEELAKIKEGLSYVLGRKIKNLDKAIRDFQKKVMPNHITVELDEITTIAINNAVINKRNAEAKKIEKVKKVKKKVVVDNAMNPQETGQNKSEVISTFYDWDTIDYYLKNNADRKAYIEFIYWKSKWEIEAIFKGLVPVYKSIEWNSLTPQNYSPLLKYVESKWYKSVSTIWWKANELNVLSLTLLNMLKDEKMDKNSKRKFLFDENGDGRIAEEKWELNKYYQTIKALHLDKWNGDWLWTVLENIWLWTEQDFWANPENLHSKRTRFIRALNDAIEAGWDITKLSKKWRAQEVAEKIANKTEQIKTKLRNELTAAVIKDLDWKMLHIPASNRQEIIEKSTKDFLDKLDINSIAVSMINSHPGLSISLIPDFAKDFVDSLNLWLDDSGNISVSVSVWLFKEFLNKYGTSVSVWISSALTPFLSVNQVVKKWEINDPKSLYDLSTDGTFVEWSVFWSVSKWWWAVGLNISKIDETTSRWIEKMVNKSKDLMEKVRIALLKWETKFPKDQNEYNRIKNLFDSHTKNMTREQKENYSQVIKNSFVQAYRNELYRNAEWIKVTGLSLWVISIAWFNTIPFIMLGWEKIKVDYEQKTTDIDGQLDISNRTKTLEEIWVKEVMYKWHKVIEVPTTFKSPLFAEWQVWKITLSIDPKSNIQVEKVNGKYYLSWDIKEIIHVEWTENKKENGKEKSILSKIIAINWGEKWKDNRYKENEKFWTITKDIKGWIEKLKASETISEQAKSVSDILSTFISHEALAHKKTAGITKLQKMIHEFKKSWKYGLDKVWNQYNKVISYKGFSEFAKEKGVKDITKLKDLSSANLSKADKIYILQSLNMSLTSRDIIKKQGEKYNMSKTIKEYETKNKRTSYFDKIFSKELSSFWPSIKEARKIWYSKNENKNSYNTTFIKDMVALSGSQIWKNTNTLSPLTWNFEVAWGKGEALVKLWELTKQQKADYLKMIPKYTLENYAKQLKTDINWFKKKVLSGEVKMTAYFAKIAQCLNDTICVDFETKDWIKVSASGVSSKFVQTNDVLNLVAIVTDEFKKKEEEETKETETKPDDDKDKTETKPDDKKEGEIKEDWEKITDENNEQKVTPIEETTEPKVPIKTDENVNRPTPIPKPKPTPIEEDKSNWWRW